jgi:hypothetical protein
VDSSCEYGNELLGSIKHWQVLEQLTTGDLSKGAHLHGVSQRDY